ncbi:unnamed protein product [Diamesa hyperborea]
METKLSFKIMAKDGRYFTREVEMDITPSNRTAGVSNFLPLCELNGDYFLENDQLTVEVEGVIESPVFLDHTKQMILRIPCISKMKKTHSSVLFKHDLGLQWRVHTEYYEGDRPFYDVFLEAVGPNYKWTCDAVTKLSIVTNLNNARLCRTKGLKFSNNCKVLHIGQYNTDEVFDPVNGFVDNFDTLTFKFSLQVYHIHGLHLEYEDCIQGIMPIVMNQLPDGGQNTKSYLSFEIKVPKLSEFNSVVYSVLDYAQNLFWVAFLRLEKIKLINQLETRALGVYVHCFDPNRMTNWSCESDVRFILKAKRIEDNLERRIIHTFSDKENTFGYNNMILMNEIVYSNRQYLLNSGISVVFNINCKPRQIIDNPMNNIIPAKIDMQGTIKMIVKDFSKFSDVQLTPDWVNIGSTAFKIMVMTHHKLFHNTIVDKVLAFYVKCDSSRKPNYWRCNTQVALKMKCHLPDMTDLVLKFEHQFSKDIVCFGFEEFLLVSVILNPAHGFIINDSIELEAFIEVTNEVLEDNQVVNMDTNNEKYYEDCFDKISFNLWNDKKLKEDAIGVKMINDWNEEQCGIRDENVPTSDVNAAVITVENDLPEKLAVEDFNYEEAIETCGSTFICKEELPENEVVIIKSKVVDQNYYDNIPMDRNKEKEVVIKKENFYEDLSIDCCNNEMAQNLCVEDVKNPVEIHGFKNLDVNQFTIKSEFEKEELQFEQQLIAEKLETIKDEDYLQAEKDFEDEKEQILVSEEVGTVSKENKPDQLDVKDSQSLTVVDEVSCQIHNIDLKYENQNDSDENNKNIIIEEVNVISKKGASDKQLVAKVCYKEEFKLEALEEEIQSIIAEHVDENEILEVANSNITVNTDEVSQSEKDCEDEKELILVSEEVGTVSKENKPDQLDEKDSQSLTVVDEVSCQIHNTDLKYENQNDSDENNKNIIIEEVNVIFKKGASDKQLVAKVCKEEIKLEALKEEIQSIIAEYIDDKKVLEVETSNVTVNTDEVYQAEKDCEDKKELILVSEEAGTVSKENKPDQLDNKDLQSLTVVDEVSCQIHNTDLKQENQNDSNENNKNIISEEVNVIFKKDESDEQLVAKVCYKEEIKLEALEEEIQSIIAEYVDEKKALEVATSNITVNKVYDQHLHPPAVKDIYSEIKIDNKNEASCQNCEINFIQEDKDVTDEDQNLMNDNIPEVKPLHQNHEEIMIGDVLVTDENKDSCVEEELFAKVDSCEHDKLEAGKGDEDKKEQLAASFNVEDCISPIVKDLCSENKVDSLEVTCPNCKHEIKQEDKNIPDEVPNQMNNNRPEDQKIFNGEGNTIKVKEESCIEEKNVAVQEVDTISKVEDNSGHLLNKDSQSPAVTSLYAENELDPKDDSKLRKEKEESFPKDNEGLSNIQRNDHKDLIIPKIIIDNYEDNIPLDEHKTDNSPVESPKEKASNDTSDTGCSDNDGSENV